MGRVRATLRMYKDFAVGYSKYRTDMKKMNTWIFKYAERKGFRVNPHKMYLSNLKIWMAENKEMYGVNLCPCFESTGKKELDRKLICPCSYAEADIAETGTCHCKLFGRGDLTDEQFREAEGDLMKEYRIKLNLKENVLDTRGVPIHEARQLDVPDSMHQVKQALNQINDFPLDVIVEREQSAKNLISFAKLKGLSGVISAADGVYHVTLSK